MNSTSSMDEASARSIVLGPERPLTIERAEGWIRVMHGMVWLTEQGQPTDVFLAAGQCWRLGARPVVLGADQAARVELIGGTGGTGGTGDSGSVGTALARACRRLVRAAARQLRRLQLGPVGSAAWV